jgi:hypothetical protein
MRLNEFTIKNDELKTKINNECSDYINIVKNSNNIFQPLLHGTKKHQEEYYIGRSIGNRSPKTSSLEYSELVDEGLEKLGVVARRLNSMYATTSFGLAQEFGNIYEVFPINGFNYTWCKYADDIVLNSQTLFSYRAYSFRPEFKKAVYIYLQTNHRESENYEDVSRIYKYLGDDKTSHYAESFFQKLPHTNTLKQEFNNINSRAVFNINKMVVKIGLQADTNFEEALRLQHEIWIHGQYIAVDRSQHQLCDSIHESMFS